MDLVWNPKSPLDLSIKIYSTVNSANEVKLWMGKALQDARFSHELAKYRNAEYETQKSEPSS